MAISATDGLIRFGLFELEVKSRQLSRNGIRIRLSQQPVQVLCVLLEHPGEIVTREELQKLLWPADVFVDFDQGLNKSIQKLREALGDSPESPRYIETVPRIGYRFIAPVTNRTEPKAAPAEELIALPAQPPAVDVPQAPQLTHRARWLALAGFAAILLLALGWYVESRYAERRRIAAETIHSLAVIPLDNLTGDPNQEYITDGMTDELITMLAKDSTLRIISRTSVMQYKNVHRPLRDIARELGADAILEGSVSRSGDQTHMTIQLIRADTDAHIWAESYNRDANNLVSLPGDAAQAIAKKLNSSVPQPASRYVDPRAHDAYLHGRFLWYNGRLEARNYFQQAADIQPDYALAWDGLADFYSQGSSINLDPREAVPKARVAVAKALELDPNLADAHLSLGAILATDDWEFERGDKEVLRAIDLDPHLTQAWHFHAMILAMLNRQSEAIEAQKKATEVDSAERPWALPRAYLWARQYDEAIKEANLRIQADPNERNLVLLLSDIYHAKGMDREAAQYLEKALLMTADKDRALVIQRANEAGGYKELSRLHLVELEKSASANYVSLYELALANARVGDHEKTMALLEQCFRERAPALSWIQCDTAFNFVHADPRYRAIVKGIGLPPAY